MAFDDDVIYATGTEVTETETAQAFLTEDDVFATDEYQVPPAIKDAHRGVIESVSVKDFGNEKGTVAIDIRLRSLDQPTVEDVYRIFPPRNFVQDIHVKVDDLPEEEGNRQKSSFKMNIKTSDGRAKLQQLRVLAANAGRTVQSVGATRATNFDEFVEQHAKLLTGLEVVFFRAPDTGANADPRFANTLRVKGVVSIDTVNNPKLLKKFAKAWEAEQ